MNGMMTVHSGPAAVHADGRAMRPARLAGKRAIMRARPLGGRSVTGCSVGK